MTLIFVILKHFFHEQMFQSSLISTGRALYSLFLVSCSRLFVFSFPLLFECHVSLLVRQVLALHPCPHLTSTASEAHEYPLTQRWVLAEDEPARGWTQEREACEHGEELCEPVFAVQLSDL